MSTPLKQGATYADLCAVPDTFVAEIIAGELYATPRPSLLTRIACLAWSSGGRSTAAATGRAAG